jgi:23S rRNA (pseudouridine1915-N3)-methyltransferase
MHVRLVAVDKIRTPYVSEACAEFRKRLEPYCTYDEIEVRAAHARDTQAATREEAERVLKLLRTDERVWLLERTGKMFSSEELADALDRTARDGLRRLTFVVAGTYGADALLQARANVLWSLSPLTFLHEWTRMIVLEQIYRAAKITRNEPYHH